MTVLNGGLNMDTKAHSPLPLKSVPGTDGRHGYIPIMADAPEFKVDGEEPYHPLIAQVIHGRGHMSRGEAEAFAALIVRAVNSHDYLVKALEATRAAIPRPYAKSGIAFELRCQIDAALAKAGA